MKTTAIFLLALLQLQVWTFAQTESNYWYFGINAGLDFSSGYPVSLEGGFLFCYDNTSTISGPEGGLLFYTNGEVIWDRTHNEMLNGSGINGNYNAGQCALIVPQPFSNFFFVFSLDWFGGPKGLHYSVVDMSANQGLGEVVQKNIRLQNYTCEKIDAIYNDQLQCYWVVTHPYNTDEFWVYRIDAGGLHLSPVVSKSDTVYFEDSYGNNACGQMIVSPQGSMLASAIYGLQRVELYDFDIYSGLISNPKVISGFQNPWGVAFSPNDSRLYVTKWYTDNVFQFDLTDTSLQSIISSQSLVGHATSVSSTGYQAGYMQMGPDEKIYIAKYESSYLGVISSPNEPPQNCGFINNGVNLENGLCLAGLSRVSMKQTATYIYDKSESESGMVFIPNPASESFRIVIKGLGRNSICKVIIMDMLGNQCYNGSSSACDLTFTTESLSCGTFFIILSSEGRVYRDKLIVIKS